MIEYDEIEGPAVLATALINDDFSGIEDDPETMKMYGKFIEAISPWYVVSCEGEAYFSWNNPYGPAGDMIKYIIHKIVEEDDG